MKATYIGKCRDRNGYSTHLIYEYRGHEYMITDHNNGYSETLATQHKYEQKRIDRLIEQENKPQKEYRYEDTAEYGLNLFYEYIGEAER